MGEMMTSPYMINRLYLISARNLSVLVMALLVFTGVAHAESIFVKGEKARLRSGPSTDYDVLWEAEKYTPFEALAKYQDWYVVRDFEGDVAWIHDSVVVKGEAVIVKGDKANIRSGPSTGHDIVYTVGKRYPFKVLKHDKGWYQIVDAAGDEGWIVEYLVWSAP